MQTTVQIPVELYERAASIAATEGIPVTDVIARGLRVALGENRLGARGRIAFPLHHSTRPGVLGIEEIRAAAEAAARQEDDARVGIA